MNLKSKIERAVVESLSIPKSMNSDQLISNEDQRISCNTTSEIISNQNLKAEPIATPIENNKENFGRNCQH